MCIRLMQIAIPNAQLLKLGISKTLPSNYGQTVADGAKLCIDGRREVTSELSLVC